MAGPLARSPDPLVLLGRVPSGVPLVAAEQVVHLVLGSSVSSMALIMPTAGGRFKRPRRAGRGQVLLTQRCEADVQLRVGPWQIRTALASAMILAGPPVILV